MRGASTSMTMPAAIGQQADRQEELVERQLLVEARQPAAMKLPTDAPRNHTPIIEPTTRAGASLVIALRPTGLRHSSANVWSRYAVDEPLRADEHAVRRGGLGRRDQDGEAEPDAEETDGELHRARGLLRPRADPQPREHRREDDDEQRVQRLEPAARESEAEDDRSACCDRRRGSAWIRPARTPTRTRAAARKNTKIIVQASALVPGPALVEKQPARKRRP